MKKVKNPKQFKLSSIAIAVSGVLTASMGASATSVDIQPYASYQVLIPSDFTCVSPCISKDSNQFVASAALNSLGYSTDFTNPSILLASGVYTTSTAGASGVIISNQFYNAPLVVNIGISGSGTGVYLTPLNPASGIANVQNNAVLATYTANSNFDTVVTTGSAGTFFTPGGSGGISSLSNGTVSTWNFQYSGQNEHGYLPGISGGTNSVILSNGIINSEITGHAYDINSPLITVAGNTFSSTTTLNKSNSNVTLNPEGTFTSPAAYGYSGGSVGSSGGTGGAYSSLGYFAGPQNQALGSAVSGGSVSFNAFGTAEYVTSEINHAGINLNTVQVNVNVSPNLIPDNLLGNSSSYLDNVTISGKAVTTNSGGSSLGSPLIDVQGNQLLSKYAGNNSTTSITVNGSLDSSLAINTAQLNTIAPSLTSSGGGSSSSGSHVYNSLINESNIKISNWNAYTQAFSGSYDLNGNTISSVAIGNQSGSIEASGLTGNFIELNSPTIATYVDGQVAAGYGYAGVVSAVQADALVNTFQVNDSVSVSSYVSDSKIYIYTNNLVFDGGALNVGNNTIESNATGNLSVNGILVGKTTSTTEMPASLAVVDTQINKDTEVLAKYEGSGAFVIKASEFVQAGSGSTTLTVSDNKLSTNAIDNNAYNLLTVNTANIAGGSKYVWPTSFGPSGGGGATVTGDLIISNNQYSANGETEAIANPGTVGVLSTSNSIQSSTESISIDVQGNKLSATAGNNEVYNSLSVNATTIDNVSGFVVNSQLAGGSPVSANLGGTDLADPSVVGYQNNYDFGTPDHPLINTSTVIVANNALLSSTYSNLAQNELHVSALSNFGPNQDNNSNITSFQYALNTLNIAEVDHVVLGVSVKNILGSTGSGSTSNVVNTEISYQNNYVISGNTATAQTGLNDASNNIGLVGDSSNWLEIDNIQNSFGSVAFANVFDTQAGLILNPTNGNIVNFITTGNDFEGATVSGSITLSKNDTLTVSGNAFNANVSLNDAVNTITVGGAGTSPVAVILNNQDVTFATAGAQQTGNLIGANLGNSHSLVTNNAQVIDGISTNVSGGSVSASQPGLGSQTFATETQSYIVAVDTGNYAVTGNSISATAAGNQQSNTININGSGTINSLTGIGYAGSNIDGGPTQSVYSSIITAEVDDSLIGVNIGTITAGAVTNNYQTIGTSATLSLSGGGVGSTSANMGSSGDSAMQLSANSSSTASGIINSQIVVGGLNNSNQISTSAIGNNSSNTIAITGTIYNGLGNGPNDLWVNQAFNTSSAIASSSGFVGVNIDGVTASSSSTVAKNSSGGGAVLSVTSTTNFGSSGSYSGTGSATLVANGNAIANSSADAITGSSVVVENNLMIAKAAANSSTSTITLNGQIDQAYDLEVGSIHNTQDIYNSTILSVIGGSGGSSVAGVSIGNVSSNAKAKAGISGSTTVSVTGGASGGNSWTSNLSGNLSTTATASATTYGVNSSTIAVNNNALSAASWLNSTNNTVNYGSSANTINLDSAGITSMQTGGFGLSSSEISNTTVGLTIGNVSATAEATASSVYTSTSPVGDGTTGTTVGVTSASATANSDAYGIANSTIVVSANTLSSNAFGNYANNTFNSNANTLNIVPTSLMGFIGGGGSGVGPTGVVNLQLTSASTEATVVNSGVVVSVGDVTATATVSTTATGVAGTGSSNTQTTAGSANAYGIYNSTIDVSGNTISAVANANYANNSFSTNNTNFAGGTAGVINIQGAFGVETTSTVSGVVIGVAVGDVNAGTVGGSVITGALTSEAYSIYNSTLNVTSNQLISSAVSNYANNTVQASATNGQFAAIGVINGQLNISATTATTDNVQLGLLPGVGTASTYNSYINVEGNSVATQALGNGANNAVTVTATNLNPVDSTTPTAGIVNIQGNLAPINASTSNVAIGAYTNASGNYGATSVLNNNVTSQAVGNSATNAVVLNGPAGSVSPGLFSISSTQVNSAPVQANVTNVRIGSSTSINNGTNTLNTVSGNTIQANAVGNSATNSIVIKGR